MRRLATFSSISISKHCESNHNIYLLHVNVETLIVALYLDDLVIIGSNVNLMLGLKKQLMDMFWMTNLGLSYLFFGIQVLQMDDGIYVSQPKGMLNLL
jgi:hypothetical protein